MPKKKNVVLLSAALPQNITRKKRKTIDEELGTHEEGEKNGMENQATKGDNYEKDSQKNSKKDGKKEKEQKKHEKGANSGESTELENKEEGEDEQKNNNNEEVQSKRNREVGGETSDILLMESNNMKSIELFVELNCEQNDQTEQTQGENQERDEQQYLQSRTHSSNKE
ncbi:uncharacterized protein LOC132601321 [Lycium barbarum]|uniref:uncharacterized protein LOC132601321 n=1 Tax=Lycium barbarum TaxID=112863 RepID=UPI00293F1420|nr:uncharacterized protein LOC132601321 [Lycium barbarum]